MTPETETTFIDSAVSLPNWVLPLTIVIVIIALLIGIAIGYVLHKKKITLSLENVILILSGTLVLGSIIFQSFGMIESFASAVVSMFSGVVFSWLLTKKSCKDELREQEQELALRSYRHINYIETAAKTAEQTINQYIIGNSEKNLDPETKLILSRALDHVGYIRGGINTCKMDWLDLLDDEKKTSVAPTADTTQTVNIDDMNLNQEDA